ncbi:MAG: dihydrofolate reductase, partial [Mesorhizobium sp.]
MSKLRVNAFTLSLDGYGAGPDQTLESPLGVGGEGLHKWMIG